MKLRIWAETATPSQICDPATLSMLQRHNCSLALSVRPGGSAALRATWDCLQSAGIEAALWPMVADAAGRWLSHASRRAFQILWRELQAAFADALANGTAPELVLDVEPAFENSASLLPSGSRAARVRALMQTARGLVLPDRQPRELRDVQLHAALAELRGMGFRLSSAEMPTAVLPVAAARGWAQRLELPATELWAGDDSVHHAMLYTSLFEGWSRGLLRRADAEYALAKLAKLARARWGVRAAVALGVLGAGAFGAEPAYRNCGELARDVAICKQAGIEQFSLFDLGGLLRQAAPEQWLEAFRTAPGVELATSSRVDLALGLLHAFGTPIR